MLSKDEDVALWTCRIISKLGFDLSNMELLGPAYDWLIKDSGGL